MRKVFEIGGLVAAVVLIGFGVAAIVMGVQGGNTVNNSLKLEQITGTPDMTPSGIKAEATKAGLTGISYPTCSVAGLAVTNGTRARCFAQYMRIHTLEATGGVPYAMMPRYATADGKGTNDATKALRLEGAAGCERGPRPLDPGDRADDRTERQLHGNADGALRNRRRHRPPALRHRLRDPGDRRGAPESRHGADLAPQEDAGSEAAGCLVHLSSARQAKGRASGPSLIRRADPARSRSARARRGSRAAAFA